MVHQNDDQQRMEKRMPGSEILRPSNQIHDYGNVVAVADSMDQVIRQTVIQYRVVVAVVATMRVWKREHCFDSEHNGVVQAVVVAAAVVGTTV